MTATWAVFGYGICTLPRYDTTTLLLQSMSWPHMYERVPLRKLSVLQHRQDGLQLCIRPYCSQYVCCGPL